MDEKDQILIGCLLDTADDLAKNGKNADARVVRSAVHRLRELATVVAS